MSASTVEDQANRNPPPAVLAQAETQQVHRCSRAWPAGAEPLLCVRCSRRGEVEGDVFDFLLTLCDFQAFKELMLSYKQASPFRSCPGLSPLLNHTSLRSCCLEDRMFTGMILALWVSLCSTRMFRRHLGRLPNAYGCSSSVSAATSQADSALPPRGFFDQRGEPWPVWLAAPGCADIRCASWPVQAAAGRLPELSILVHPMPLLTDEDEQGEPRPDLDTQLRKWPPPHSECMPRLASLLLLV